MEFHEVNVGDFLVIKWSNGAGFSLVRVKDNPGSGPHELKVLGDFHVTSTGGYELEVPSP